MDANDSSRNILRQSIVINFLRTLPTRNINYWFIILCSACVCTLGDIGILFLQDDLQNEGEFRIKMKIIIPKNQIK